MAGRRPYNLRRDLEEHPSTRVQTNKHQREAVAKTSQLNRRHNEQPLPTPTRPPNGAGREGSGWSGKAGCNWSPTIPFTHCGDWAMGPLPVSAVFRTPGWGLSRVRVPFLYPQVTSADHYLFVSGLRFRCLRQPSKTCNNVYI